MTDNGKKEYLEFCERYFEEIPNEHLYSIRRFITKDFVPLEIIGINSLALQQYRGRFQGMGYIGDDQIRQISKELINFEKKFGKPNRIIVIHQHIMPVAVEKPDFDRMHSLVLDSEKMIEKLVIEFDVKAVLHGHTHKDFYSKQIRQKNENEKVEFSVIGIGSVGVAQVERGSEPNVYGLLEVNKENIEIKIYEVSSENVQRKKAPKNIYKIEL
ncbi:metallophosphoesterase family protein [Enterococcus sp. DIV0187]|uniref:metallophosphoesterase family protein n=1 Tax=Enterococcus sp. DIV0187 TaxID=2774644 RepID=UPI003F22AB35